MNSRFRSAFVDMVRCSPQRHDSLTLTNEPNGQLTLSHVNGNSVSRSHCRPAVAHEWVLLCVGARGYYVVSQ